MTQVLFTPTHCMKTSITSYLHLGSKFLLSKMSLLSEILCVVQKNTTAVTFSSIWLNCVPIPGTMVGPLGWKGLEKRCVAPVPTPLLHRTTWPPVDASGWKQTIRCIVKSQRRWKVRDAQESPAPCVSDGYTCHDDSVSISSSDSQLGAVLSPISGDTGEGSATAI